MSRVAALLVPLFPLAARLRSEPELAGTAVSLHERNRLLEGTVFRRPASTSSKSVQPNTGGERRRGHVFFSRSRNSFVSTPNARTAKKTYGCLLEAVVSAATVKNTSVPREIVSRHVGAMDDRAMRAANNAKTATTTSGQNMLCLPLKRLGTTHIWCQPNRLSKSYTTQRRHRASKRSVPELCTVPTTP